MHDAVFRTQLFVEIHLILWDLNHLTFIYVHDLRRLLALIIIIGLKLIFDQSHSRLNCCFYC